MVDVTTAPRLEQRSAVRYLVRVSVLALAYLVAGKLSLLLAIPPGYATAVWPSAGFALAGILLGGFRFWPGIWIGSFLVNISTSWDPSSIALIAQSLAVTGGIATGAALQAVVGALLIRRFVGYTNIFTQEVDVVRILLLGGPASCIVNPAIGVTTLWVAGLVPASNVLFSIWTWWVGDSIGVLIFLPLVCAWALRPTRQWLRKQMSLTVPLVAMFAVLVCLFFFVSNSEQASLRAEFDQKTQKLAEQFQTNVNNDLVILDAVGSFFAASDHVTREQFQLFVRNQLQDHPDIKALEWIPRITESQRAGFESMMQAAGVATYRIREEDPQGRVTVAQTRPVYFPVAYIEPREGNEAALGFDVGSEPTRRAALEHALQTGHATATARIRLIQERGEQWGVIIFIPVFRGALNYPTKDERQNNLFGFGLAVFRIGDLAKSSLQDISGTGLRLKLVDATSPASEATLYEMGAKKPIKPGLVAMSRSVPVLIAERQWMLNFALPADYLVAHRSWQAWGLLAAGLFVVGLLGMLILVLIARQAKVEELVRSQTAELMSAEKRFRRLLENTPDAMVITDQAGKIQLVNAQIERLFGYSRQEMIGQAIELVIPDRLKEKHRGHRTHYFRSPQVRPMGAGIELWGRRKDGSEVPIEISLSPLETEEGIWATAAIRDISERILAEAQLANYAKDLERSNEELEQFAYVASHDLQAPLRSIVGFGQLLQKDYKGKLDSNADTYINFMVKSASQMKALIRALLTFSRVGKESTVGESANCEEVLADVLMQLQPLIEESGVVITHDPLPVVSCAPLELHQVFQNLLGNAIKFQAPGKQGAVHVGATREGDCWTLSVRDNGIGIDPKYSERIFQMFQRLHTPDSYEGTGIGLAICRKIVQRQGGRMWVESEPGQGSTFYFTLPWSPPK